MNALKRRWQSGCLSKVLIVGGVLVLLVWWFLVCWFLVLFAQGMNKAPVGEVRTTGVVTPKALERSQVTTVPTPRATTVSGSTPARAPLPTDTPRPPASKPTVFPWEKEIRDTPEAEFGYQLGRVLGAILGRLLKLVVPCIIVLVVGACVLWMLKRRRANK